MPIAGHHPRIVEIRPTIAFKRIPIMSIPVIDLLKQKRVAACYTAKYIHNERKNNVTLLFINEFF